jgi:16S rRNA (uracil1498-N3)-methyltransferase
VLNPRTAAAHVYVASVDEPVLEPADRHHLERVLRLRPGAEITVGDGRGHWRPAVLGDQVEPRGIVVSEEAPRPALTVGFAVVKGDRPDLVVRALTEIGIDRIVPLHCARSVVRWTGERQLEAVERLRRVVRSAGMQSRRVWLPEVSDVHEVGDLLGGGGEVALGVPGAIGAVDAVRRPTVLVGPEGGWTPGELAIGEGSVTHVGLGPHVLRSETAAIAAGVLLVAAFRRPARR